MFNREELQDRVNKIMRRPYIKDTDLYGIYLILLILPLSGGNLSQVLSELTNMIEQDIDLMVKHGQWAIERSPE
uniref:Uncharacterized protein n=1 Tax=viral metagenome TaxID=1070528 RepID=A0A6M3LGP7_9ZZZZ